MFKYLWIVILVLADILWIALTIYNFTNCYKDNVRRKTDYESGADVILNALADMDEVSYGCIIVNAVVLLIASLIAFLISVGGVK